MARCRKRSAFLVIGWLKAESGLGRPTRVSVNTERGVLGWSIFVFLSIWWIYEKESYWRTWNYSNTKYFVLIYNCIVCILKDYNPIALSFIFWHTAINLGYKFWLCNKCAHVLYICNFLNLRHCVICSPFPKIQVLNNSKSFVSWLYGAQHQSAM